MSNKTFKAFVDKMGGTSASNYIGNEGELFYDPTTTTLRVSDGSTPGGVVLSSGSITYGIVSKTSAYTITPTDYCINCKTNSFTVTLPTSVGLSGQQFLIKNSNTIESGNFITLDTTDSQTIDGETSVTLAPYTALTVMSDGTNWIIV